MKFVVTNVSAVGIIFRQRDPRQIFLEMKDDSHPIKHARMKLCPVGGNWIGESAMSDRNPLDTFRREAKEELSFERPRRTSLEYYMLGVAGMEAFDPTPMEDVRVEPGDEKDLRDVVSAIIEGCVPFGTYFNSVSKEALDDADPENERGSFTALACYWAVGLNEVLWATLERIQRKFNNLSNESVTLLTSVDKIVSSGTMFAFGHDRVFQQFFLAMGIGEAREMQMVPKINSFNAGQALATYEDYLKAYEITKRPR